MPFVDQALRGLLSSEAEYRSLVSDPERVGDSFSRLVPIYGGTPAAFGFARQSFQTIVKP